MSIHFRILKKCDKDSIKLTGWICLSPPNVRNYLLIYMNTTVSGVSIPLYGFFSVNYFIVPFHVRTCMKQFRVFTPWRLHAYHTKSVYYLFTFVCVRVINLDFLCLDFTSRLLNIWMSNCEILLFITTTSIKNFKSCQLVAN